MSNYQTVNLPRELAERIAKVCMFTMFAKDSQELRAILARPSGEPAAWFTDDHLTDKSATTWDLEVAERWRAKGWPVSALYTHADPGEVERLREQLRVQDALLEEAYQHDIGTTLKRKIRAQHAAVSASADPSAPVEADKLTDLAAWKRRAIEAESKLRTYDPQVVELGERAMQALLAEPKPKELVLTKCKLCDQLQADLTARDQQIDALRQGMKGDYDLDAWLKFVEEAPQLRLDAGRYRWLRSRDLETISQGGVFAGLTPDNLVLNEETLDQAIDAAMTKPKCRHCGDTGQLMVGRSGQTEDGNAPIMEPCEDCDRGMPDLASRPEERGTPETEPCSGCGTPGWTGACNKCVPY